MNGSINILDLVLHASLPVKFVLAILIVFSFTSWVIIFRKKMMLDTATRAAVNGRLSSVPAPAVARD